MKKAEVEVGKTYIMNHTSGKVPVTILSEKEPGRHSNTHWRAMNLKTRREIEIKSAAKLLRPATTQEVSGAPEISHPLSNIKRGSLQLKE